MVEQLDGQALTEFVEAIGAGANHAEVLRARGYTDSLDAAKVNAAAVLLFAPDPEMFLANASIRIIRYDGNEALAGARLNITLDRRVSGPVAHQIRMAESIVDALLIDETHLDPETGRFVTIPDIPHFVWLEAIVNAVTHRSYSLQGNPVLVQVFDDRIEVHSPGGFAGPVRSENIRSTRFSRNPRISRALIDLGFVRELNEGVRRMFQEMEAAGLPEPKFIESDAGVVVTLARYGTRERLRLMRVLDRVPRWMVRPIGVLIENGRITTSDVARLGEVSVPTARRQLEKLAQLGELTYVASGPRDPRGYWTFVTPIRGRWSVERLYQEIETSQA